MGFKEYIMRRFGISLPEWIEIKEGSRIRLYTKSVSTLDRKNAEVYNKGINAGRLNKGYYKPSTDFLQMFGFMATRNIVVLNEEEGKKFISGKTIKIDNKTNAERGYVVVFYMGKAVGCGLLKEDILESNVPKWRRMIS